MVDSCNFEPSYYSDKMWILPNGRMIQAFSSHSEIFSPLDDFTDKLIEEYSWYEYPDSYHTGLSILNMVRLIHSKNVANEGRVSVDVNIDTEITESQWRTIKKCIDTLPNTTVYIDIDIPEDDDWEDSETIYKKFEIRPFGKMRLFVNKTKEDRLYDC